MVAGQLPVTSTMWAATPGNEISWVCSLDDAACPGRLSTSDSGLDTSCGRRPGSMLRTLFAMPALIWWMLPREADAVTPIAEPGRPVSSLAAAPTVTALKNDTAAAVKVAVTSAVRMTTENATRCVIRCLTAGGGLRNSLLLRTLTPNSSCLHDQKGTTQRGEFKETLL